jgi:Zn-dependent protease/predicted transcriptional regulator
MKITKKSLLLGKVAGIDLYIHWTFGLLIVGLPAFYLLTGYTGSETIFVFVLVMTIFVCVVLHELGHALVARRFDVPTRDITLYPIGGIARLQRMPTEPMKEFWIAIAGPAVNVAIALGLIPVVIVFGGFPSMESMVLETDAHFLPKLLGINIVLVAFNLLPAFPMDGGRVLRALLATRMNYLRATHIASRTGQVMAIFFGLFGFLFFNPILMFIALFVYLGAQQEEQATTMRTVIQGVPIQEAMMTRYETLSPGDTLQEAVTKLLAGSDQDFPVTENGHALGVLTRKDLMKALAEQRPDAHVSDVMRSACPIVEDTAMLDEAFQRMQESQCPIALVTKDDQLIGVLSLENVGEYMMIATLTGNESGPPAAVLLNGSHR